MQTSPLDTWHTAERLLGERRQDDARAAYLEIAGDPEFAVLANLRLSLIASSEGRYRDAVAHALAAAEAGPDDADVIEMVCKRLLNLGETETAVRLAASPAMLQSKRPGALAQLGKVMTDYMQPESALRLLRAARGLGWDSAAIRYLVGLSEMQLGNPDAAEFELDAALQADPDFARAARSLSKLAKQTPAKHHVQALRESIARIGDEHADAPLLHYALFKELDDLGDTNAAWTELDTAMRLRRAQVRYDAEGEQALFEHLQRVRPQPGTHVESEGPMPIFIVGLPRSGTTLLERVLGGHHQLADAGELRDFVFQTRWMADVPGPPNLDLALAQRAEQIDDWAQLGERYLAHTRWRATRRDGKAPLFYTDKLPLNFLNIGYIVRALPNARIVHMIRDPMDTCFSNLKENFASAYTHSYDQLEMADHYRRYRQLMAHWTGQFPNRIHQVRYSELVSEPEGTTRELLEHIGLPWQDGLTDIASRHGTVATASAMQVREPIHARTLGQWRRYEDQLAPMMARLGSYAFSARA
jgi:tetratricopeptide (TPR) repeat protein